MLRKIAADIAQGDARIAITGYLLIAQVEQVCKNPDGFEVEISNHGRGTRYSVGSFATMSEAIKEGCTALLRHAHQDGIDVEALLEHEPWLTGQGITLTDAQAESLKAPTPKSDSKSVDD